MTTFKTKTDKINITALSLYLGYKTEAAMRKIKQTNPERFETLYLGALCSANNIDANDLTKYYTSKKENEMKKNESKTEAGRNIKLIDFFKAYFKENIESDNIFNKRLLDIVMYSNKFSTNELNKKNLKLMLEQVRNRIDIQTVDYVESFIKNYRLYSSNDIYTRKI